VSLGLPVGLDVELRQRSAAASSNFMRLAKRRFSSEEVAQLEGMLKIGFRRTSVAVLAGRAAHVCTCSCVGESDFVEPLTVASVVCLCFCQRLLHAPMFAAPNRAEDHCR
jgi:hypothetical protein